MSNEKRLILFLTSVFAWMLVVPYLFQALGLNPPPRKNPQQDVAAKPAEAKKADGKEDKAAKPAEVASGKDAAKPSEKPSELKTPVIEHVDPAKLVLGSAKNTGPKGYQFEIQLTQKGAGVESVESSQYEAEFEGKNPHRPLPLIRRDPLAPPSMALSLVSLGDTPEPAPGSTLERGEIPLGETDWEVVPDDKGRIARPIPADAKSEAEEQGREIVFRTKVGVPPVILTKTYRLDRKSVV